MKIILFAEGSYPYVAGGVASWVQMLVTAMPEHEFELVAISSSRNEAKAYKYELPPNLTRIHNVYMMDYTDPPEGRGPRLSRREERACLSWFEFEEGAEEALPFIAERDKFGSPLSFLKNEALWQLLVKSYRREMPNASFHSYFWAWRSMYAPAIHLLQQTYPEGDLYHAVSAGYAGLIASCLKKMRGTPFIMTEHGLYARERENEIMRSAQMELAFKKRWVAYFCHLSQSAYRTADRTVALYGGAQRTQLELGAPPQRSLIIPNGIPYSDMSELPRQAAPSGGTFVFGALARIVPIKDIKTLLYATRIASRVIANMQLWIMGPTEEDPVYYEQCVQLAASLHIEHLVAFTGKVDIKGYLPKVDVLLLSSVSEGQPLALLEGMAAGIPWVCTDVGSCRELLEGRDANAGGAAGIVVPPSTPDAMAEAMVKLYRCPGLRADMGQAGRRRVASFYRIDRFVDAYRQVYAEVTS